MRKGKVLNLSGFRITQFISKNSSLIILALFFLIGVILGTFLCDDYSYLTEYSSRYLTDFIAERSGKGFLNILLSSFSGSLLALAVNFILGASMLGVVLVPFSVGVNGFLYGCVTAFIYSQYSLKGIAFNAVMILPSAIVFMIALVLAAIESVRFSLITARLTLPRSAPSNLFYDFKNYCGKYAVFCVVVLISAVIDAVISCSFMGSFVL